MPSESPQQEEKPPSELRMNEGLTESTALPLLLFNSPPPSFLSAPGRLPPPLSSVRLISSKTC